MEKTLTSKSPRRLDKTLYNFFEFCIKEDNVNSRMKSRKYPYIMVKIIKLLLDLLQMNFKDITSKID